MQIEFIPPHESHRGRFNTYTSKEVNLLSPDPSMICIEDIAHALSNICRFGGQSIHFYSVAQHSVMVAALAPPELKREALMHDAAEAYLGDVIKPLKLLLGDRYDTLEHRFDLNIRARFGLHTQNSHLVKDCDMQALEIEHELLIKGNPSPWNKITKELKLSSELMAPKGAERYFLAHFHRYFNAD